ncbi:MAG: sigma-54 dependent transcriptional regulator, partial [Comamonas sp.]
MSDIAASILVIDDEPDLRTLYELTLLREGYRVETAESVQEARAALQAQRFDAVLTDMRLPDGLGLELLHELRAQQRPERCVVITAHSSAENAVEALRAGAFDYLSKPVDLKQFRAVVASAVHRPAPTASGTPGRSARGSGGREAEARLSDPASVLAQLVGESPAMRAVKQNILKVAKGMAPVLVQGESGTGKELVARALHFDGSRSKGPFIEFNCASIPANLLEAELFGHEKGAFTGAVARRIGKFEEADGGTLLLDEISEMDARLQAKLLRAIQERRVRPLGSTQEEPVDVRIVSATHRDLAQEVPAGRFRQDLYYRLNVIEIHLPPLRERREDLPALCEVLLERIAAETGCAAPQLSVQFFEQLARLPLTGNVRELENQLHRALTLSEGQQLSLDAAAPDPLSAAPV